MSSYKLLNLRTDMHRATTIRATYAPIDVLAFAAGHAYFMSPSRP